MRGFMVKPPAATPFFQSLAPQALAIVGDPASTAARKKRPRSRARNHEDTPWPSIRRSQNGPDAAVSTEALRKAESYIEADEGATNRLSGLAGTVVDHHRRGDVLFHLYARLLPIVPTQPLRYIHVAFVLVLSFLLFPMAPRFRNRIRWWDVVPAVIGAGILIYAHRRAATISPTAPRCRTRSTSRSALIFIVLLLEATRRTTGLIMPVVSLVLHRLRHFGPYLPQPWTHRGFDLRADRRPSVHHARRHLRRRRSTCRRR